MTDPNLPITPSGLRRKLNRAELLLEAHKARSPQLRAGSAVLLAGVLVGVFWWLDRHVDGPLGLHDVGAVAIILAVVLAVAFPQGFEPLIRLVRAIRGGQAPPE